MNLKTCPNCEEKYFIDAEGISPAFTRDKNVCDRCKKQEKKEIEEKNN